MKCSTEKGDNIERGRSRRRTGDSALRLVQCPWLPLLLAMVMMAMEIGVVSGQEEMEYPSSGVNFEPCRSSDNCAGARECLAPAGDSVECTDSLNNCVCLNYSNLTCSTSEDCDRGERCIKLNSEEENGNQACLSCQVPEVLSLSYVDENPSSCQGVWPGGYSFDICGAVSLDCEGSRSCRQYVNDDGDLEGESDSCANEKTLCFCKPTDVIKCSSTTDCEEGDQCAKLASDSASDPICMSCGRVAIDPDYEGVDSPTSSLCTTFSESSTSSDTSASPSPVSASRGSPSSSPRPFVSPGPPIEPPCIAVAHLAHVQQKDIVFAAHQRASVLCDSPESTPHGTSAPAADSSPYSSPGPSTDPGTAIEPPCIAVAHLAHVQQKDLVFAAHQRASVLCDSGGSCATRGHIVTFYGRPMSMASYCSLSSSSCSARVAYVNSPRMQRGLKIASLTRGLHFTTFSARYESRPEEIFLSALIYSGF